MNAVVTVIGEDKVGIIANISKILLDYNVNILDINQTIMQDFFTMIMMVEISKMSSEFDELSKVLEECGVKMELQVKIQHEDIFNSMHRI